MQKIIQLKNNDNILQQQQINNPSVPLVTNTLIQNSTQSVTSNQDNYDQIFDIQKQNTDLRIIGNYGSKKILSDINQVETNFETEIGVYNLKNKKLKLIQKNLTKHYNYIAKQEDQLSQQVKRDIYFHLFQKNQKYQEILQKHYLEIKDVEKEKIDKEFQKSLKIIEQRRMEKINKQNKPKKGGNRELANIFEGLNSFNKISSTRSEQCFDRTLKKLKKETFDEIKQIPKSHYIENINEGSKTFPQEIYIIPPSCIPTQLFQTKFYKQIIPKTKGFYLDQQNLFRNFTVKIKNIIAFLKNYLPHPHQFQIAGNKIGSHGLKLRVLYDLLCKSKGLNLKQKSKYLQTLQKKRNPQDQEYLEKTLIPLLKQQFKSIFSKFIEDQYGLYEPSFPIFEQFISFEELRTVLYNWDNLTQRLRYSRDH